MREMFFVAFALFRDLRDPNPPRPRGGAQGARPAAVGKGLGPRNARKDTKCAKGFSWLSRSFATFAIQTLLDREVALKVLDPLLWEDVLDHETHERTRNARNVFRGFRALSRPSRSKPSSTARWRSRCSARCCGERSWTTKRTKGHEMRERLFVAFALFRGLRDPNPPRPGGGAQGARPAMMGRAAGVKV